MSSFRSHRVIIASLFLPSTAVLGSSYPATPHSGLVAENQHVGKPTATLTFPASAFRAGDKSSLKSPPAQPTHRHTPSLPGLRKSIVEDLKDKVCNLSGACSS
jgi:trehalose 6-phosphate synthase complex regulatory subunit